MKPNEREYYIGQSIKTSDNWIWGNKNITEKTRKEEMKRIQKQEEEIMMQALGQKPKKVKLFGKELTKKEMEQLLVKGGSKYTTGFGEGEKLENDLPKVGGLEDGKWVESSKVTGSSKKRDKKEKKERRKKKKEKKEKKREKKEKKRRHDTPEKKEKKRKRHDTPDN
eukprot:TRINITY_DN2155_c0_g1_i1.p1 TRINITY_DN2155_c0_g1~~TRINITY_DN2155_c0_g1_i1.p1  ORF type:complete len:194 (-),score=86.09 TRINITY_DN2155_c0_g1_i1:8-508(-)